MAIRSALAPAVRWPALWFIGIAIALAIAPGVMCAQAGTGKLEGMVWDGSGSALAEAQIMISGTAFFALTDARGHYFINNIPSGTVSIRAVHLGHRPLEVVGLRVLAGQTITQDFILERAPVQLGEIAVVAAENDLVPRDEVTTKQRIDGEFLRALPVEELQGVLEIQPGVAAYTGSVRGGRSNEVVTYVDGVPVSPAERGFGSFGIAANAVEEASLTTGATSAEFGNAMSGVVSIQTRSGGSSYSGALSYETDEPFGAAHGLGLNRIEAAFGGPIARNLTFFLSGALVGIRSPPGEGQDLEKGPVFVSAGLDTTVSVPVEPGDPDSDTTQVDVLRLAAARGECDQFRGSANQGIRTNYGLPCTARRFPFNPSTNLSHQAKLSYTYGTGSRVTLTYLGRRSWSRETGYDNFYNLQESAGFRDRNDVVTLEWTQNLARSPERALALQTYFSYQEDRGARSALTPESERASRDPFGGLIIGSLDLLFDFDNFPLTEELVRNIDEGRPGVRVTPYDPGTAEQLGLVDRYRNNAYGLLGWFDGGGPSGFLGLWLENRYVGRSVLDWQVDRFNRLKLGGEFIRYRFGRYESCCPTGAYLERPIYWDLFVEDRLDLGDVVLVGGLRLDAYHTGTYRDYVLDTVPSNPRFGEYVPWSPPFGLEDQRFDGRPLVLFREDPSHGYLSPHVQVAFPVTARTNIRLSYAHQVQAPDFRMILGEADIDFGQTIAHEFGVRHALSDDMVLDVVLYNKDNRASPARRTLLLHDPLTGVRGPQQFLTNADFGNTRGIELRLDARIGRFVNGTLGYTYQSAKSTASDPFENSSRAARTADALAGVVHPPPQGIITTRFSRPHSLMGTVAVTVPPDWRRGTLAGAILGDVGLFAMFLYTSGLPYTPCPDVAGNAGTLSFLGCPQIGPLQQRGALNSVRLPALRQFDLRITKGFDLGRVRITPYLDARNVLGFHNVLSVFAVTGTVTDDAHRQNTWTSDSAAYADEAAASGALMEDGAMDLRFGGAVASGCGGWVRADGLPAAPSCVYLIRAEERYGDGDHVFTLSEQRRASEALYNLGIGPNTFAGDPRRLRIGVEVTF